MLDHPGEEEEGEDVGQHEHGEHGGPVTLPSQPPGQQRPHRRPWGGNIINFNYIREAFILKNKENYGKFHNRSAPPPPPLFWPKLWKILKNINYFMASKSGLVLK